MKECQNCGAPVSPDFVRVFAGNDGVPRACRECATTSELFEGHAARGDVEAEVGVEVSQ